MNEEPVRGEAVLRSVEPNRPQPSPPRILVVDDEKNDRILNVEVLRSFGYEVDAAEDGAAAWEALQADCYDLMITDCKMPKMSGIELLEMLRAERISMPVIMATGVLPKPEFTVAPWLEPAATLLKPYTSAKLLETVKEVLGEADGDTALTELLTPHGPREIEGARSGEPASAPSQVNSASRVLVVEQDNDLRLLYAEALAHHGYQLDCIHDGALAWQALQSGKYKLLITGHDLPTLTGIELVRKVRAARLALPVVMIAGNLPDLAREPSLQLAAALTKPVAMDALLEAAKVALPATDSPH